MDISSPDSRGFEVDFTSLGERLLAEALVRVERSSIDRLLQPELAKLDEATRAAIAPLIEVLAARIALGGASLKAIDQELQARRRDRASRIAVDPLQFIPSSRWGPPVPPPASWEVSVGDAAFTGSGWHRLETDAVGMWRWAGPGPASTVLLPGLGGGHLELTIQFKIPFRLPYTAESFVALLDGVPLALERCGSNACSAVVELPKTAPTSRAALVIVSQPHLDPRSGPERDDRTLGIGLMSVRLRRLHPSGEQDRPEK